MQAMRERDPRYRLGGSRQSMMSIWAASTPVESGPLKSERATCTCAPAAAYAACADTASRTPAHAQPILCSAARRLGPLLSS